MASEKSFDVRKAAGATRPVSWCLSYVAGCFYILAALAVWSIYFRDPSLEEERPKLNLAHMYFTCHVKRYSCYFIVHLLNRHAVVRLKVL